MQEGPLFIGSTVERLDPLMKQMMKDCTKEVALNMKDTLSSIDGRALQKLHLFIIASIVEQLKCNRKLNKEIKTILLDCICIVLTHSHLNSVIVLKNILNILMMEIFDETSPNMIRNVPEELKLSVVNCAFVTINNMQSDVQSMFYVKENIPEICHIAYTCLELAVSEKLKSLRIRAMEVILALMQIPLDGPDVRSPWDREAIADIFQFILPGASSRLMSIVCGDITQGKNVLTTAILTLSSMIAIVMEDYHCNDTDDMSNMIATLQQMTEKSVEAETNKAEKCKGLSAMGVNNARKLIETSKGRTPEWRKKIASHLIPYLFKLGTQCEHSDPTVCKMVVNSCFLIILRSPTSLKEGLSPLLDAIVTLSVHEDSEVRKASFSSIKQLREYFLEHNRYDFMQLAEENFYVLLTRLPRLVQEEGGARGASSIALLSGYVQLLRFSMRNVLSSSAHLQRLTLSLLHVVTLECSSIDVSTEHTTRQLTPERCDNLNVPWTFFRFSIDRSVLANIQQLFDIIVEKSMGVFDLLGSQLVDTFQSVPHFRRESILLLNLLLLSACKLNNEDAREFGASLLEIYLSPNVWPSKENSKSVTTIVKDQQDIATVCLLTEGISCCASALGKEKAQIHLLRILYHLLEQAGSANGCISLAGRRALSRLADVCGYDSDVISLISNNMDYLSHCMSLRLKHASEQMGVFNVLSLVLSHSSPEIALGLYNIVVNVLHQSSDISQKRNNEAHLRVFLTYAFGVHDWLKPSADDRPTTHNAFDRMSSENVEHISSEELDISPTGLCPNQTKWNAVQKLKEYQKNLKLDIFNKTEDVEKVLRDPTEALPEDMQPHIIADEVKEDDAMDISKDGKEEIPELAKLLVLVLKRCLHFLPSSTVEHQFLAMRTLEVGLKALEPYTDTLLPIVHLIWNPLVGRFEANQAPLIIRSAFKLLQTMARTAKDFLMKRTIREVFPQLAKFLKAASNESHLKDQASVYRFSQKYKTQLSLLSGMGSLACHLQVNGQDFYSLLSVSLLYLSCYQPRPLQAAAISFIKSLYSLDSDAVWWALVSWCPPPHLAIALGLPYTSLHKDCEENIRLLLGLPQTEGKVEDQA